MGEMVLCTEGFILVFGVRNPLNSLSTTLQNSQNIHNSDSIQVATNKNAAALGPITRYPGRRLFHFRFFALLLFFFVFFAFFDFFGGFSGLPSPSPRSFSRCASAISAFISAMSCFSFSSHSSRVWA